MLRIHMFEQRSKEWEKVRMGKFTASNFHYLMGHGYATKTNILMRIAFERLTGRLQQPRFWTPDMQRGIDMEPIARRVYERITGNTVRQVGFIERDDWSGASPDGLIGFKKGLEIKCPSRANFLKYKKRTTIRPDHMTQMQFAMFCGDLETYDYVIYCAGEEPIIQRDIERDNDKILQIHQALENLKIEVLRHMKTIRDIRYINRCSPYYRRNNNFKWRAA